MRKLLLAIAVLWAGAAQAQVGQVAGWPPTQFVAAGGGYSGPGDVVSGAAAWWGLRAYNAANADGTHKAINISRASDSHTCDVLLTTSGGLGNTTGCSTPGDNGTDNVAWCNATSCAIITWYDQSGHSLDVTQATALDQSSFNPSATVSSISATFGITAQGYCSSGTVSLPQTVSVSAVYKVIAQSSAFQAFVGFDAAASQFVASTTGNANSVTLYAGSVSAAVTSATGSYHAGQAIFNGSSSEAYIDGSATTGLVAGAGSASAAAVCFGNEANANFLQNSNLLREGGIWPAAAAASFASNLSALNSNQHTYWGF